MGRGGGGDVFFNTNKCLLKVDSTKLSYKVTVTLLPTCPIHATELRV